MQYSRFYFAAIAIFISGVSAAQTRQRVNIEQATVFLKGAELFNTAKVSLPAGESEMLFTNIAGNVNEQSLNIGADKELAVLSATFQNNYLEADNISPKVKALKDTIETVKDDRQLTDNKLAVVNEQLALIQDNRKVAGNNTGLAVAELQKMLDLVNAKMEKLLLDKQKYKTKLTKTDELLAKLQQQLQEEQQKDYQPGGQLLVKFYSKEPVNANVNITYVVPNAGWNPSYDLRVEDITAPVKLSYKANVFQNSGVKWNNVRLVLSTGNPSEGAQAPALNPWYLASYNPIVYDNYKLNNAPRAAYRAGAKDEEVVVAKSLNSMSNTTINDYVTVDNSGINTTFDIDLPYTIPTDGQNHLVAIKTYQLPATYRYYAVPKMDKDAFLQAQLTNWEDLNLLPASTNIFYEGNYVGQGYIDVRNTSDTLTLSLGRDKKIVVRRERDKKLRTVKTIGTNTNETFVYTISIRNTRKQAIDLLVLDQFPVSNDKDIVVEDKQYEKAEYNETTGELKWKLHLDPNESKKVQLGYNVKYPRGKTIAGLK